MIASPRDRKHWIDAGALHHHCPELPETQGRNQSGIAGWFPGLVRVRPPANPLRIRPHCDTGIPAGTDVVQAKPTRARPPPLFPTPDHIRSPRGSTGWKPVSQSARIHRMRAPLGRNPAGVLLPHTGVRRPPCLQGSHPYSPLAAASIKCPGTFWYQGSCTIGCFNHQLAGSPTKNWMIYNWAAKTNQTATNAKRETNLPNRVPDHLRKRETTPGTLFSTPSSVCPKADSMRCSKGVRSSIDQSPSRTRSSTAPA